MTERATLHTSLHKIKNRQSHAVSKVIIQKLNQVEYPIYTITFDNNKRFADHMPVAKALHVKINYTRPYTCPDNRTVENRI